MQVVTRTLDRLDVQLRDPRQAVAQDPFVRQDSLFGAEQEHRRANAPEQLLRHVLGDRKRRPRAKQRVPLPGERPVLIRIRSNRLRERRHGLRREPRVVAQEPGARLVRRGDRAPAPIHAEVVQPSRESVGNLAGMDGDRRAIEQGQMGDALGT